METTDTSDKVSRAFLDLKRDIAGFAERVHGLPGGPEVEMVRKQIQE